MSQDAAVRNLQKDAANMMAELSELTAKLREAGKTEVKAGVESLNAQLDDLHERVKKLATDSEALSKIDKSVRANPYLYILGALGLGMLLGKILRS